MNEENKTPFQLLQEALHEILRQHGMHVKTVQVKWHKAMDGDDRVYQLDIEADADR